MKTLQSLLLPISAAAMLLVVSNAAQASNYMGYVQGVAQLGTRVFIYIGGGWFGTDSCGTGRAHLIIYADTSTPEGKTYIALATAAKLSGNQVYAAGNGTCLTGNTPNGASSEAAETIWLQ